MTGKDLSPRLTLETILNQEPPKRTSLLKLFCPSCGALALTEKDGPGVYRVSCGGCRRASIVEFSEHFSEKAGGAMPELFSAILRPSTPNYDVWLKTLRLEPGAEIRRGAGHQDSGGIPLPVMPPESPSPPKKAHSKT